MVRTKTGSLCPEVIEAHGGNLGAPIIQMIGATFSFTLPFSKLDKTRRV